MKGAHDGVSNIKPERILFFSFRVLLVVSSSPLLSEPRENKEANTDRFFKNSHKNSLLD